MTHLQIIMTVVAVLLSGIPPQPDEEPGQSNQPSSMISPGDSAPVKTGNGPPEYVIIHLGTFGGWVSTADGVNNLAQVAGGADTTEGLRHAFLWEDGQMTDLGVLPLRSQSEAYEVNDSGQVVGISTDDGFINAGFLWSDGQMIDVGHLTGLPTGDTSALAINNLGQVVGSSLVGISEPHAFLWENGNMQDLGTLGGRGSIARDINNLGQVVGASATGGTTGGAFLWENGVMGNLGTLGGQGSGAMGLNDLGQIVGSSERAGDNTYYHAFLWENGVWTDLGAIGEFKWGSRAWAINNLGQVVGRPGFLYDPDTGMHDLEELIPGQSPWSELSARDINDLRQIVGTGTFNHARRAFLMSPVGTTVGVCETAGEAVCNDHDVCTRDRCVDGACVHTPNMYGDVDQNDSLDVSDLFCVLQGFGGDFESCSSSFEEADIHPCSGNGAINVFDLFAVLNAVVGSDPCCAGGP